MQNTAIEWASHTFNPWRGCTKVSAGCAHCYADTLSKRNPLTLGVWGPTGTRVVAAESAWREPLKWDRMAKAAAERHRVFCASLADVFEDWSGPMGNSRGSRLARGNEWHVSGGGFIPTDLKMGRDIVTMDDCRIRLFDLIRQTPHLDWLLLTKRPQNVLPTLRRCIDRVKELGYPVVVTPAHPNDQDMRVGAWMNGWLHGDSPQFGHTPPKNLWLGTSVEDQAAAGERMPHLLAVPAAVRFLSMEPLLGPVNFNYPSGVCHCGIAVEDHGISDGHSPVDRPHSLLDGIDWVIVGGESGHQARPMHPNWARGIRDQCKAAGVPFFFKQWGEWGPGARCDHTKADYYWFESDGTLVSRFGKKTAGRLLDGAEWSEFPTSGGGS